MNGIYCYIDKNINKVVYIGKDNSIDKNRRYKEHLYPSTYNYQPFNRAIQQNPDRYEYKVLKEGEFSENLLNALEILYIKKYGTYDNRKRHGENYGFNFTIGGGGAKGYTHSEETKHKMSEAHKGEKNHLYGKNLSESHKYKISESMSGENNPNYGKPRSEQTRKKISRAKKGKKKSDETKEKISKSCKGNKNHKKYDKLWDISCCSYDKFPMFINGREPNPTKCFNLRHNGNNVCVGGFIDFLTPKIISNLINEVI